MNPERLLREVERRLAALPGLPDEARAEALDAVREEVARERRRVDPTSTVESERERRLEEETLREVLEAINRQASLDDTIGEVLKQLSRIVSFDSCSVALRDREGSYRIIAARGFPAPEDVVGVVFKDEFSDLITGTGQPATLPDVQADTRFARVRGTAHIRSWAGLPLLVEGDIIGILSLDRWRVEPFGLEDLHRAKAVAFSAAAAIRKAQLLEQLRRYANLMELTVQVDQAVFAGEAAENLEQQILEAAVRMGSYRGGLLVLEKTAGQPEVAAASRELAALKGVAAPAELNAHAPSRLGREVVQSLCARMGMHSPTEELYLVPVATRDRHLGALVLCDANGESADDRLMEAFASRVASAYTHARRRP